jgi:RluA family pseudouridine synthase
MVHVDPDLIVVDKPAGLLSVGVRGRDQPSALAAVREALRPERERAPRVSVIHRLDREASGLLLFARSERAFAWLKQDLRTRRLERAYLAVVEGELGKPGGAPTRGTVQSFLRETPRRVESIALERFRGSTPGPGSPKADARLATTHYRLLAAGKGASLLEVTVESGRKHQVRVHLRELGHPVLGDRLYGAARGGRGRLHLHAAKIAFAHPENGQRIELESPPPAAFFERVGLHPGSLPESVPEPPRAAEADTSWEQVAPWYDDLLERRGSDHYRNLVVPGTLRLLELSPGLRVLDLACGQGLLARELARRGAEVVAIDASPSLIEKARRRSHDLRIEFRVGDARALDHQALGRFDAIACVLALANLEPLAPVLEGCAGVLRPGGSLVAVLAHPAFRAPRQTAWGFEVDAKGRTRQYRRVDGYLSPAQARIVANPGAVARGEPPLETWTFHRPLQSYVEALAAHGLWVDRLEEWPSLRHSQPGPRAAEENRARREIPLFLALRARPRGP